MKVGASAKRRCKHCQVVSRKNKVYVICPKDKRHKQRQG